MKRYLPALLSLLTALPLHAAAQQPDRIYQVEVIVFRATASSAGNTELWPALENLPDFSSTLTPDSQGNNGFLLLPPERYELNGAREALAQSGRYEPLLHTGWTQPALDREQARAVRVRAGTVEPLPGGEPPAGDAQPIFGDRPVAQPLDPAAGGSPGEDSGPARGADAQPPMLSTPLDGAVTIISNLYLYAVLDLVYTPEGLRAGMEQDFMSLPLTGPEASQEGGTVDQRVLEALARGEITLEQAMQQRAPAGSRDTGSLAASMQDLLAAPDSETKRAIDGYRLQQTRRIRLNELHYFDHPMFGVLLKVTPVKQDDAARRN